MRSVYAKILLWCFATLVLSLAALGMVSQFVFKQMVGRGSFFDRINVLLLEQAAAAYESGGPAALASHLKRADTVVGGEHHLIDPAGKDLATGEDLSALARRFQFEKGAIQKVGERMAAGMRSPDGRYRLLVMADSPFDMRKYIPYYLPILAAVALLCWALAAHCVAPSGSDARRRTFRPRRPFGKSELAPARRDRRVERGV